MPLDAPALSQALGRTAGASTDGLETVHTLLCRREAGAFQRAAKLTGASGDELLVACTQERRLFRPPESIAPAGGDEDPVHRHGSRRAKTIRPIAVRRVLATSTSIVPPTRAAAPSITTMVPSSR